MSLRYLEDHEVGQRIRSPSKQVSAEEIVRFASEWDPQPFHVDEEQARASIYGGITACTGHIFSITSQLGAQMEDRPAAMAGLGFDQMKIHRPLRPGDTVYYITECRSVRRSRTKPDRGIVEIYTQLFNQREEVVLSVLCTMMVRARGSG